MLQAVKEHDENGWLTGGYAPEPIAIDWIDSDFYSYQAIEWWGVGGFSPGRCAQLRDAGISPEMASSEIDAAGYDGTIAYHFSNGDISFTEAIKFAKEV